MFGKKKNLPPPHQSRLIWEWYYNAQDAGTDQAKVNLARIRKVHKINQEFETDLRNGEYGEKLRMIVLGALLRAGESVTQQERKYHLENWHKSREDKL